MSNETESITPSARTIMDKSIEEQRNQLPETERIIIESITEARKPPAKQTRFKHLLQKQGHGLRDVDNGNQRQYAAHSALVQRLHLTSAGAPAHYPTQNRGKRNARRNKIRRS